ncbi:efflux RND transporter periplasmic adaptor subunit [Ponticaulis profundi]|uniref:Efflux RND transporter periplasmic adaptor subunit n=1 Tax=Ponticaulis profundi TaxID=2665222 RepID=A0ABW1S9K1_9PROT
MAKRAILLSGVLAAFCAVLTGCSDSSQTEPARPESSAIRVVLQEVSTGEDVQNIESVGTARARLAATIYPESNGEVQSINFQPGQKVKAGQVLARLDSRNERLAVERAEVTLKDAQQLLQRYERIDVPEAVSESQIDEARTAVEAARIDLELAEEALSRRTVFAPFEGYVGLTDIDPGARVTTSTVLTQLDDRGVLKVDFSVPEQVFGRIQEGTQIPITPFAAEQQEIMATVETLDTRIEPERRTFTIRTAVENASDELRPGMSFRMTLSIPGNSYPQVPEAAISWGGDGAYLWAVEGDAAKRVPITIVSRKEGRVLLKGDVQPGDLIVAEGIQKMREGVKVEGLGNTAPTVETTMRRDTETPNVMGATQ